MDVVCVMECSKRAIIMRTPVVRQVSWTATIPQVVSLVIAITVASYVLGSEGVWVGALVYLTYSIGARMIIPRHHRAGVRLIRQQKFSEATACFRQSLSFFDRHAWVDDYRSVVLMSASAVSYREMALANIGFCYAQLGDGRSSRESYEECLRRFPNSGLAATALRMMDAAVNASLSE